MANRYIEIYSGDTLLDTRVSVSEYDVESNYALIAYVDGTAIETSVKAGGAMVVSGGTATGTTVYNTGVLTVNSGSVSDVTLHYGSTLNLNGAADGIGMRTGGTLNVNAGGTGTNLSVYGNTALVSVFAGGTLKSVSQQDGVIALNGGYAEEVILKGGTFSIGSGSLASEVEQSLEGSVLEVLSGGLLKDVACQGAEITVASGGVIYNSTITGYTSESPFSGEKTCIGTLTLESGAIHKGTLSIASYGKVVAQAGAIIDFTVAGCTPGTAALLDNLAGITGTPDYRLTVSSEQQNGVYALAEKVSSFAETILVQDTDDQTLGTLTLADALVTHDYSYTLALAEQSLSLAVTDSPEKPHDLAGNAEGIVWQSTANQFSVQYTKDGFASALTLQADSRGMDTYALPSASYDWRVKSAEGNRWTEGETIFSEYASGNAEAWQSNDDDVSDIFFANASGTWTDRYLALHVGVGDWNGTQEFVSLSGKNRISDTFTGSDDANFLVLTDDANGDALFVDDIYTAFPSDPQARIAQIDEIRAGAGDDVVDMTSQAFEYTGGGITIRGGEGNDTIWTNKGDNLLFGDAGDDRLVGASGNDILIGGSGDDSMHGGGGDDVFCFCEAWGTDAVQQLAGGSVTLWFASGSEDNWNQSSMTYVDGDSSVKVSGVSSVVLKFGDDGSEQYDNLVDAGCFLAESSSRIFETQQSVSLAVL